METINLREEKLVRDFRKRLEDVDGIDDMFPPDTGVREPNPDPPHPTMPPQEVGAVAIFGSFANSGLVLLSENC